MNLFSLLVTGHRSGNRSGEEGTSRALGAKGEER